MYVFKPNDFREYKKNYKSSTTPLEEFLITHMDTWKSYRIDTNSKNEVIRHYLDLVENDKICEELLSFAKYIRKESKDSEGKPLFDRTIPRTTLINSMKRINEFIRSETHRVYKAEKKRKKEEMEAAQFIQETLPLHIEDSQKISIKIGKPNFSDMPDMNVELERLGFVHISKLQYLLSEEDMLKVRSSLLEVKIQPHSEKQNLIASEILMSAKKKGVNHVATY